MAPKFTRKDFLEALFGNYYKEHRGFILVKSFRRGDSKMSTRYFPNIEILAKEQYGEDRDVYFGICPRERMKSEIEHILHITALWADMDIGAEGHSVGKIFFEGAQQAAKAIRSFPRPPSITVDSGRGLHLYWLLEKVTEVSDLEKVERILKNIHQCLQCGGETSLDTVMRLPETFNNKLSGEVLPCSVTFINHNFRYNLADFENLDLPITGFPRERTPVATTQAKPSVSTILSPLSEEFSHGAVEHTGGRPEDLIQLRNAGMDRLAEETPQMDDTDPDFMTPLPEALYFSNKDGVTGLPAMSVSEEPQFESRQFHAASASIRNCSLEMLVAEGTEVEIALIGYNTAIHGILKWTEGNLIGVESGEHKYAIPLSSVSFIKYR